MVTKSVSFAGFRAADFDLAHVADIEDAHGRAHGVVLVDDSGVLDGHVPSAEIDHLGPDEQWTGFSGVVRSEGAAGMKIQANTAPLRILCPRISAVTAYAPMAITGFPTVA